MIIGAPLTIIVCKFIAPDAFSATGTDEVWRGMAAIAGSWIGGGANQVAMQQMFKPSDGLFSSMILVDVIFSNILLAVLLFGATKNNAINRFLKADTKSIDEIKARLSSIREQNMRIPTTADLMMIVAVGLTCTGLAHLMANQIGPFIALHYPEIGTKFSLSNRFFFGWFYWCRCLELSYQTHH